MDLSDGPMSYPTRVTGSPRDATSGRGGPVSDRMDVVIVQDGAATILHQRWGATALVDLLLGGPDGATDLARAFDATDEITDVLAACVIDHDRRAVVLSGRSDVISAGGPRRLQPEEVLPTLAPFWAGWELSYEPEYVLDAVVLYVRGLGIPLRSMNEPHALSDYLARPRFVAPAYRLRAEPQESAPLASALDPSAPIASLELSVRAENELENAGLATVGDLIGKDRPALIRAGLSDKTVREITEILGAGD